MVQQFKTRGEAPDAKIHQDGNPKQRVREKLGRIEKKTMRKTSPDHPLDKKTGKDAKDFSTREEVADARNQQNGDRNRKWRI